LLASKKDVSQNKLRPNLTANLLAEVSKVLFTESPSLVNLFNLTKLYDNKIKTTQSLWIV